MNENWNKNVPQICVTTSLKLKSRYNLFPQAVDNGSSIRLPAAAVALLITACLNSTRWPMLRGSFLQYFRENCNLSEKTD